MSEHLKPVRTLLAAALLAAPCLAAGAPQPPVSDPAAAATRDSDAGLSREAAGPIAVGLLAVLALAPGLLVLATRRGLAPSWPRLLAAAVHVTALAVLLPLGIAVWDEPRPLAVTGGGLLACLGLAHFLRRGARWARALLVAFTLLAVALAAWLGWFASEELGAHAARLVATLFAVAPPSFAAVALLHPSVGRAFARDAPAPGARPAGFWDWRRLLAAYALLFGLGATVSAATFTWAARPPPPALEQLSGSLIVLAALVMVSLAGHLWRGTAWARWAFATTAALVALGLVGVAARSLLTWSRTDSLMAGLGSFALLPVFLLFVVGVSLQSDVGAAFAAPDEGALSPTPVKAWLVSAALALPFLLASWQLHRARVAHDRLTAPLDRAQLDLRKLEVTAASLSEFRQASERLDQKVEILARILPAELDAADFVARLDEKGRESGVAVQAEPGRPEGEDLYDRVTIDLRLEGSPDAIARLARSVESDARLATWQAGAAPDRARVTLYATSPPPEVGDRGGPCSPGGIAGASGPWLWPFAGSVERLRDEMQRTCARLEPYAALSDEVARLVARREWVERTTAIVRELRSAQTLATTEGAEG